MTNKNWTRDDESQYQEMHIRRSLVLAECKEAVIKATRAFYVYGATLDQTVESLILNADQIRDALKPYDNGVRVKDEVAT